MYGLNVAPKFCNGRKYSRECAITFAFEVPLRHLFVELNQLVRDLPHSARFGIEFLRVDAHLKRCTT